MKFVAAHDLLNVKNLSITPDSTQVHSWPAGMKHANLINKGTRFSIGTSDKADDLTQDEKVKANWLIRGHPKSVQAVAADDKAVARIDTEVRQDIKKFNEMNKPAPDMASVIAAAVAAALPGALVDAGLVKAKA